MSTLKRHAVAGLYKGHYCRSLHEFHACLYYDLVEGKSFVMEPCKMISPIDGKGKIPDMLVVDYKNKIASIIEIKSTEKEIIETEATYYEKQFILPTDISRRIDTLGLSIEFKFFYNCKNTLKPFIIKKIGKNRYKELVNFYKKQRRTYTGFPGELNPNFGKKMSVITKKKISARVVARGGHGGKNNAMYGKTHTFAARQAVGAKWYDIHTKNDILITSLLNKLSHLTYEQYNEFIDHTIRTIKGIECGKLPFMNGTIKLTEKRIISVFGTFSNFWNTVNIGYY
jgi:hypothetical protein